RAGPDPAAPAASGGTRRPGGDLPALSAQEAGATLPRRERTRPGAAGAPRRAVDPPRRADPGVAHGPLGARLVGVRRRRRGSPASFSMAPPFQGGVDPRRPPAVVLL